MLVWQHLSVISKKQFVGQSYCVNFAECTHTNWDNMTSLWGHCRPGSPWLGRTPFVDSWLKLLWDRGFELSDSSSSLCHGHLKVDGIVLKALALQPVGESFSLLSLKWGPLASSLLGVQQSSLSQLLWCLGLSAEAARSYIIISSSGPTTVYFLHQFCPSLPICLPTETIPRGCISLSSCLNSRTPSSFL